MAANQPELRQAKRIALGSTRVISFPGIMKFEAGSGSYLTIKKEEFPVNSNMDFILIPCMKELFCT